MSSYGQVAAQVAERKRLNPELFCPAPRCLWRRSDGTYCPKHKPAETGSCSQCHHPVTDHHEGCMYFS